MSDPKPLPHPAVITVAPGEADNVILRAVCEDQRCFDTSGIGSNYSPRSTPTPRNGRKAFGMLFK